MTLKNAELYDRTCITLTNYEAISLDDEEAIAAIAQKMYELLIELSENDALWAGSEDA